MSVIVKGMNMPSCCYACLLYSSENYGCRVLEKDPPYLSGMEQRMKGCPLIELRDGKEQKSSADWELRRE